MTAPGKGRIREVQRRLRAEQGAFAPKPVLPVIDEVVATVLSQHTSDTNSERAFAQLKERFSSWERVAAAPAGQVADAIRCGGIADRKARRIQQILAAISEREGRIDLGRLHDLDDTAARAYLESLPGVGPKTAACVLTFAMGRAAFPVDTHVHRVATRLGWLPAKTAADRAHPPPSGNQVIVSMAHWACLRTPLEVSRSAAARRYARICGRAWSAA